MSEKFVSKTAQAITLYQVGEVKAAWQIAKSFRLGLDESEHAALCRAYECLIRPEFYRSIGFVPERVIAEGREVFEQKIMRVGFDPAFAFENWQDEMAHTVNYDGVMG